MHTSNKTGALYKLIADNSLHAFTFVLGAMTGACALVFSGAFDAKGQGVQLLIAVMTAITSGTILAVVTRTNEKETDRRKVLRKVLTARKSIRNFCETWVAYRSTLVVLTENGRRLFDLDGHDLEIDEIIDVVVRAERI